MAFSLLKNDNTDSLCSNCDDPRRAFLLPIPVESVALENFIPVAELADHDIAIGLITEFTDPLDITVLNMAD